LEKIVLALDDENQNVRVAAINALQEYDSDSFIEKLVLTLDDKNPSIRVGCIRALQSISYKGLEEKILPILGDTNPDVKISVIKALQECEFQGLIEKILPCLHDNEPEVVAATINTLREVEYDDLELIVYKPLVVTSNAVRAAIFLVLFELDSKFMKDQVYLALNDKAAYVRIIAACIYMASKSSQLTKEQIRTFANDVRHSIANLKNYHGTSLMIMLYAISQLNDIELIDQHLIPKLSDPDPSVRRVAVLALSRANLQNFKDLVTPMLKDTNRMVRRVAAQELVKME